MLVRSHVRLLVIEPVTAPDRIVEQWVDGLKTNAQRINEKRQLVIPDEEAFVNRLAAPANTGFAPVIDPAFISRKGLKRSGIVARHFANLKQAYENYRLKLEDAFATKDGIPAKTFKELVDRAKDLFARGVARWTLPLVGTRASSESGPAPLASAWLVGDQLVIRRLRGDDQVLEGGPYLITMAERRSAFKAALTERLTQAGTLILQSQFEPTLMLEQNTLTNNIVQVFINPALGLSSFATGGASHVDFVRDGNKLFLDIMVSQM